MRLYAHISKMAAVKRSLPFLLLPWGSNRPAYTALLQHFSGSAGGGEEQETREGATSTGKEIKVPVSSLRIDTIASAGLDIARKKVWEMALNGDLLLNGTQVKKKSSPVKEGDIIEADTVMKPKVVGDNNSGDEELVKRGRVVVKEIGEQTRKGGYHMTLVRIKQFALFHRKIK